MSALLDEIIAARKAKAIEYEEYLKRIAELAKRVEAGQAEETPEKLNTPGKRALYNNLSQNEELALKIDETVRNVRPDGWRGVQAREQVDQGGVVRRVAGCRPRWSASSSSSKRRGNTDGHRTQTWRDRGGRGAEGHQERPSRASIRRPAGCGFRLPRG